MSQSPNTLHKHALHRLLTIHESLVKNTDPLRVIVIKGPTGPWLEQLIQDFKTASSLGPVIETICSDQNLRPYQPIREILTQYITHLMSHGGEISEDLTTSIQKISTIWGFKELALTTPVPILQSGSRHRAQGHTDYLSLRDSLGHIFVSLSIHTPVTMIIQNIHLSDMATRETLRDILIHHLLEPLRDITPECLDHCKPKGCFILTLQDGASHDKDFLDALRETGRIEEINLNGIDEETVRLFLQRPDIINRVVEASRGNLDSLEILFGDLPSLADETLSRHVRHLTSEQAGVLNVLVVYALPISPASLARLSGLSDHAFTSALHYLRKNRLVRSQVKYGQIQVSIPHQPFQPILYQRMDPVLRASLHQKIGDLLNEQHHAGLRVDIEERAYHLIRGNNRENAIEVSLRAAEYLHIGMAHQRAIQLLEQVLPLLELGDLRRDDVLFRLTSLHQAIHNQEEALQYFQQLKDNTSEPVREWEFSCQHADILLSMGQPEQAYQLLAQLFNMNQPDGVPLGAKKTLTLALVKSGRHGACLQQIAWGYDQIKSEQITSEYVELKHTEAICHLSENRLDIARACLEEIIKWCDSPDLKGVFDRVKARTRAQLNMSVIDLREGLCDEAIVRLARLEKRQRDDITDPFLRGYVLLNLSVLHNKGGDIERAIQYNLDALKLWRLSPAFSGQLVHTALNQGAIYLSIGLIKEANALCDYVQPYIPSWNKKQIVSAQLLRIVLLLQEGSVHLQKSRQLLNDVESIIAQAGLKYHEISDSTTRSINIIKVTQDYLDDSSKETLTLAETLLSSIDKATQSITEKRGLLLCHVIIAKCLTTGGESTRDSSHIVMAQQVLNDMLTSTPHQFHASLMGLFACRELLSLLDYHGPPYKDTDRTPRSDTLIHASETARAVSDHAFRSRYHEILGDDKQLIELLRRADSIATSDASVLILGDSGTGKELLARAIHQNSSRAHGPMVTVNCGAFVDTLLMSELFGHEKGAFTGAVKQKKGLFEQADRGTLFLDEIGDISPLAQVALLRVLQEGTFIPVGGTQSRAVNVRILCATHHSLASLVKQGDFRLDLYYRLKGVTLELPPLRERPADIITLASHFLDKHATEARRCLFGPNAIRKMLSYNWPGNIRELEHFTRAIMLFVPEVEVLDLHHLIPFAEFFNKQNCHPLSAKAEALIADYETSIFKNRRSSQTHSASVEPDVPDQCSCPFPDSLEQHRPQTLQEHYHTFAALAIDGTQSLKDIRKNFEVECIRQALERAEGNITQAALLVQVTRPRLSQIVNANPDLIALRKEILKRS